MQFHINPGDELPIYRQIMRQIQEAVAGHRLRPGDKLASHRELAERLVIAPLTVKKAYDELERAGFLSTQRGRGTFVAKRPPAEDGKKQRERLKETARRIVTQAYLNGVPLDVLLEVIRESDTELKAQHGKESE